MRRAALLLALLGSCSDDPEDPPRPPEPPPIPAPGVSFVHTQPPGWDIQIWVPADWKDSYRFLTEHEVQFAGPGEPGAKPELDFGWKASDRSLATFAADAFRKYESPAYKVLGKGDATIAGMPALYCVFETAKSRGVEYCFAGHGYIGFVRGISMVDGFPKWGAVFEQAAKRTAYRPR